MVFTDEQFTIINENVLATRAIEKDSIDLIVTSPPYNVDIKYNSNDDDLSYADYLTFSEKWFTRCFQWLKPDGRFCLNIPLDKNKGGQQHVGADLTKLRHHYWISVPFYYCLERRQYLQTNRLGFMDAGICSVRYCPC